MSENSFCVITFYSTHLALKFAKILKDNGLQTRLIPVPRSISSSCGIAGKVEEEQLTAVKQLCKTCKIEYEQIYRLYKDSPKKVEIIAKVMVKTIN